MSESTFIEPYDGRISEMERMRVANRGKHLRNFVKTSAGYVIFIDGTLNTNLWKQSICVFLSNCYHFITQFIWWNLLMYRTFRLTQGIKIFERGFDHILLKIIDSEVMRKWKKLHIDIRNESFVSLNRVFKMDVNGIKIQRKSTILRRRSSIKA